MQEKIWKFQESKKLNVGDSMTKMISHDVWKLTDRWDVRRLKFRQNYFSFFCLLSFASSRLRRRNFSDGLLSYTLETQITSTNVCLAHQIKTSLFSWKHNSNFHVVIEVRKHDWINWLNAKKWKQLHNHLRKLRNPRSGKQELISIHGKGNNKLGEPSKQKIIKKVNQNR